MSNFVLVCDFSGKPVVDGEIKPLAVEITQFGGKTNTYRISANLVLITNHDSEWQREPIFWNDPEGGGFVPHGLPNRMVSVSQLKQVLSEGREDNRLFGRQFEAVLWNDASVSLIADAASRRAPYYYYQNNVLICGTRERLLLAHPKVSTEPDLDTVGERLAYRTPGPDRTVYKSIVSVPSGCKLRMSGSDVQLTRWAQFGTRVDRTRSIEEVSDSLRTTTDELLFDYTIDPSNGNSRGGLYFSGGLDSSVLAGLLKREELDAHYIALMHRFPGLPCDESEYQDSLLSDSRLERKVINARKLEPELDLMEFTRQTRLPQFVANPVGTDSAHFAHEHTLHSVLSGYGGDELFATYDMSLLDHLVSREMRSARDHIRTHRVADMVKGHLQLLPRYLRAQYRRRHMPAWLGPELKSRGSLARSLESFVRLPGLQGLAAERLNDCTNTGFRTISRDHWSFLSDRFRFEVETPFYDPRLLHAILTVPETLRANADDNRHLQRVTYGAVLPQSIQQRRGKVHFDYQYAADLQHPWICELLQNLRLDADGLVDGPEIWSLHQRLERAFRENVHAIPALAGRLWAVIGIEAWWRDTYY